MIKNSEWVEEFAADIARSTEMLIEKQGNDLKDAMEDTMKNLGAANWKSQNEL